MEKQNESAQNGRKYSLRMEIQYYNNAAQWSWRKISSVSNIIIFSIIMTIGKETFYSIHDSNRIIKCIKYSRDTTSNQLVCEN